MKESDAREEALVQFLGRIRDEGAVSYKRFSNADELAILVRDDLALLLAERFTGAESVPFGDGDGRRTAAVAPSAGGTRHSRGP